MLTPSIALSSSGIQWVCIFLPSPMHDWNLILPSIVPSIASVTCTRVFLELRGSILHSGTESPLPCTSGTSSSYRGSSHDRNDHLRSSRQHNRRNLSLDFFVSDPGGTTAQSTSTGVYELTTFGNNIVGMEASSNVGFTGRLSSAPSAQTAYGASTSKP